MGTSQTPGAKKFRVGRGLGSLKSHPFQQEALLQGRRHLSLSLEATAVCWDSSGLYFTFEKNSAGLGGWCRSLGLVY